jgi:predicted PurR-regulated permease PerM
MLYVAQEVLLPIALAILLTFILTPLTSWLERLRIGRIPSVLVVVTLAFVALGGIGWMVTDELIDLARDAPKYRETLTAKIRSLRAVPVGGGLFAGLAETVTAIGAELDAGRAGEASGELGGAAARLEPVPVTVVENSPFALRFLLDWLGPLLAPVGTAAMVLLFVIFMLLAREDLRNRLIRLAGTGRVYVTTQAFDEAGERISNYLLMQVIINATYGLAVTAGLLVIGVPSALLWGLLAAVMRFVPYVGPWIAAILPIALSLAVFEGWFQPVATVGWFLVLELLSNNVMEPWLYGSTTGVSTVGIIASAVFWTWLWGPLGLVLSMPLTVCLTVLGRHVPRLGFLNVLLSDEPALQLDVRLYQRLLALDYNEANDVAVQFLKSGTLDDLYERLLIPALSLEERDRHAGHLTDEQAQFVFQSVRDLIPDLESQFDTSTASETLPQGAAIADAAASDVEGPPHRSLRILCVPAEDEADRLAGEMLMRLLRARGHDADTVSIRASDAKLHEQIRQRGIELVVVSGLAPGGAMHARSGCWQIRKAFPQLTILVGLWNAPGSLEGTRQRLTAAGADVVSISLADGLNEIQRLSREGATSP